MKASTQNFEHRLFTVKDRAELPANENSIQQLVLPNPKICSSPELYIRITDECVIDGDNQLVSLRRHGVVDLGTYFNSFSIDKWKKYTCLTSVSIFLRLKGRFKLDVYIFVPHSENKIVVHQRILESSTLDEYVKAISDFDISNISGLLCFRLEALTERCYFKAGEYTSLQSPVNKIDIALVTCTYKRELMVQKTVQELNTYFSAEQEKYSVEIFIIDNGNTLVPFIESNSIHVIPNRNSGGSGGFARGLIEVLDKNTFTHVILMDDDIVVDPNSISRVIDFLRYSKDTSVPIAGSMMYLDEQYLLHESGASFELSSGFTPLKHRLDLRDIKNVAFNDSEEYFMYGGWWFYCMSITQVKENGLPYPFFLKLDDVEYGMRVGRTTITLNGCCAWHESFIAREKPAVAYYCIRNLLIFLSNYFREDNVFSIIKFISRDTMRHALMYRYENARFVLKGVQDYLDGPIAMKSRDPEVKNREILSTNKEVASDGYQNLFVYPKYNASIVQTESRNHRRLRILTLNGHLLPDFLMQSARSPLAPGFRVLPILPSRPLNVFRAKKALYYDLVTQRGYLVYFSRIEFFSIIGELIVTVFKLAICFPKLRKEYMKSFDEFTTVEFWKEYLNINTKSSQPED
jgi:galactofuranosylgalactofuranosylrhamnosyl-N-acetylglucosaminyl-diphospho-decaprenol beta-1,5/1,6-galactofuranosyltransferase